MNGVMQDENMFFYMMKPDGTKHFVDPPTKLRVVGVFFPHRGTDETPIHLERFDKETETWTSL